MAPCCTAQSDGGGIYPASEGTGRGECEVQRAFPRLGPVHAKAPLWGASRRVRKGG